MGVLQGCIPRPEVLTGDLEDSILTTGLGDIIANRAPAVYICRAEQPSSLQGPMPRYDDSNPYNTR